MYIVNTNKNFWKNNCENDNKTHPSPIQIVAWNKICIPKCEEGLGIKKNEGY